MSKIIGTFDHYYGPDQFLQTKKFKVRTKKHNFYFLEVNEIFFAPVVIYSFVI